MINIRHQVRYWIKLNICKAGSWETVRTPHSPYGVVMKEVWREFIWQESLVCCETQCHSPIKRGARWLFLTLKQVEGWWVHSVSLWSVSSYWVGNVWLIPEETQGLLSSLVVGTKQQRLLLPWTFPFSICEGKDFMSVPWTRCSCTRERTVKKDHSKSEQTVCWCRWWSHTLTQSHFKMCLWLLHLWLFYDNKHCC